MASLPSPTQVSGKHNAIYEAYYKQVDPKGNGTIEALDAAKFLKKSGLSDVVLSRIWDLSDPKGRGCLDKAGFFVSLKLVSLAQAGHDINMRNICMEPPNPPKVGEIPKIIPQSIQSVPASNTDWSMKPSDWQKYEQLFNSLQPVNGLIAGNKVKGVLMDSKLPLETLGKIWDLADQDKDGSLDKHEFAVAMHLVYQALDKRAIPSSLPPELQKPKPAATVAPSNDAFGDGSFVANFPKDIAPPPVPPLPAVMTAAVPPVSRVPPNVPTMPLISPDIIPPEKVVQPATSVDWVVTPEDRIRFEAIFKESDRDKDGLVSGFEVKNVFLQSGVPQNCLAHIWALCDTKECGKLTLEQFALAMWMVERKKNGIEPPEVLTPNMIPPSLRGSVGGDASTQAQQSEIKPTYSNPELEMISKEIEELARERRVLETDIAQKEADIRIKSGEVRSLQSELDTLTATLKQLENQKGEAQKRLDDLKTQVNKIREQCQKQESTINEQETELNSKRSELQKLKDEETALEKEYDSNRKELDKLTKQSQDTQLQISQVKAMVTQLLETQRQMSDALLLCKAAIEANDAVLVSDYSLKIEPEFQEAKEQLEKHIAQKSSGFGENDAFGEKDAFASDAFNKSNGFASDPFVSTNGIRSASGFDDSFSNAPISGFDDAFGGGFTNNQTKDPFTSAAADPFGDKKSTAITPEPGKDDFGSDPFAILHAPTSASQVLSPNTVQKSGPPPRPESPSPALPPKKAKQPPPRPAPPRPLQGPTRPAPPTTDAFGSSTGGFADFADFDNKQPPPLPPPPIHPPPLPKTQQQSSTITIQQSDTNVTAGANLPVATDFSEDPFKDYRYEDPFSIKDPFADDDDGEISSEDLFSDDSKIVDEITTQSNKDHMLKLVDKFNMKSNPSNVMNNKKNNTNSSKTDSNFANFDAFGTNDNNNSSKLDFFDAFNDNFQNANDSTTKVNSSLSAFDAVGDTTLITNIGKSTALTATTTTTKTNTSTMFNTFNDSFEDAFFKMNITNKNDPNDQKSNFAKFDAFGDDFETDFSNINNFKNNINDTYNNNNNKNSNQLKKDVPKNNAVANKKDEEQVTEKFVDDYSVGDNFNADLEAALQRSLTDQ